MKEYLLYLLCALLKKFLPKKYLSGIPVLMYHSISDSDWLLAVSSQNFSKQMKYLSKHGYQTISPPDLLNYNDSGGNKNILITFDDGFADNYIEALPILEKYGYKATVFIATQYFLREKSDLLKMLTIDELKKLEKKNWTIANHFYTHQKLTEISEEEILNEYFRSKQELEKYIENKHNLSIASYPHSRYNNKVIKTLKKSGLKLVFGGDKEFFCNNSNLFAVPRIQIDKKTNMIKFKLLLNPAFYFLRKKWKKK